LPRRSAPVDRFSRRAFLRSTGALAATTAIGPGLLAACGDDDDGGGGAGSGPADVTGEVGGQLDFLWYEGYDLKGATGPWLKSNGVKLRSSYIGAYPDLIAKFKSGGADGIDVAGYTHGDRDLALQAGVLAPLDEERIPNLEKLYSFFGSDFQSFWFDDDGNRIGVPFSWGSLGITYDSKQTSEPAAWQDLLDPRFKGKLGNVADPAANLTCSCAALGLDSGRLTKADLDRIVEFLKAINAQTKGLSPSWGDMTNRMVAGEISAAFAGWAAMNAFAVAGGSKTVRTNITPAEGGVSYVDSYAIPSTTDNAATAYAWVNATLDPEVNAKAADEVVAGAVVEASFPLVSKDNAAIFPYKDLEAFLDKSPPLKFPPLESDEFVTYDEWLKTWNELATGA
jgi:spermidine/putrescine transport system substrate-binding protein